MNADKFADKLQTNRKERNVKMEAPPFFKTSASGETGV